MVRICLLLSIMTISAPTEANQSSLKFDIICKTHARLVVDYSADLNQPPGYLGPSRWDSVSRYSIDLFRGRYSNLDSKQPVIGKFARKAEPRLWFSEDLEGFERYNLKSNRYYGRRKVGNWLIQIETGRCQRAPFSGFVPNTRVGPIR